MSNLSNVYVEKVYSEHPLSAWTLDEDVGFISFLSAADRVIEDAAKWSISNASVSLVDARISNPPVTSVNTTRITGTVPPGPGTRDIELVSIFDYENTVFDDALSNFALGFYLNIESVYISTVKFGYRYFDTSSSTTQTVLENKSISDSDRNQWVFFGKTFDLPPSTATDIKLVIRLTQIVGGGSGDYISLLNGLSFSQWSEQYNQKTVGTLPVSIPSNISLPSTFEVIPAIPYGESEKPGYYLVNDTKLRSINYGIPLAYGSSNVTKIFPNVVETVSYPSIIFPGYGFLNNIGLYNQYTLESWIRINTDVYEPVRIFGPIASSDGLYVENGYLTLVVGKYIRSHYVGEWFRPMLIHIKFTQDLVSMMVNGEEVFAIPVVESQLNFPSEFDSNGKSQDWLGFYTTDEIASLEIDSFAIYSYPIPNEVAKRRWVWGQGVPTLETINSSLNAVTAANDYAVANYGANYSYPNFGQWSQGFFSNVSPSSRALSLPEYSLPTFVLDNLTLQKLYDDNYSTGSAEDPYLTFRPNSSWNDKSCRLSFDQFGLLVDPIQSFYGIFSTSGVASKQTLFRIENLFSGDFFEISVNNLLVSYTSQIGGDATTVRTFSVLSNQKFIVGADVTKLALLSIDGINKFFVNQGSLSLQVGGSLSDTFTGKIYRVGFNSQFNNRTVSQYFDSSGILVSAPSAITAMGTHVANYTIKPYVKFNTFYTDIAAVGYWEDYLPLSYFGKYVTDFENNSIYDLDYLQFNMDYPETITLQSSGSGGTWTYNDLRVAYSIPVRLTYADLGNNIFTGWNDYEDMSLVEQSGFAYDTSKNKIKAYVSFQEIADGANKTILDYTGIEPIKSSGVIDPNTLVTNWEDTMYEALDNTVIYPPLRNASDSPVSFNSLALVSHIRIESDGLIRQPIRFRDLQLSSNTLNKNGFTPIGTKFGIPIFPYTREGLYYNFAGKNPVTIYKESTPYLYTTNNSGWRLRGEFSDRLDRGISMALNVEKSVDFEISAFQMWFKYSERAFPTEGLVIASIDFRGGIYDFYLEDDGSTGRGYIYAKNRETGADYTNLRYFINGQSVTRPYILKNSWAVFAVSFNTPLAYTGYTGRLNVSGPLTYNNIAYFLSSSLERSQSTTNRAWARVKLSPQNDELDWSHWIDDYPEDNSWNNLKVLSSTNAFAVNPKTVYDLYLGTNRSIVDDNIDGLEIDYDKSRIYSNLIWSNLTKSAV
jgi:hypothetical protein